MKPKDTIVKFRQEQRNAQSEFDAAKLSFEATTSNLLDCGAIDIDMFVELTMEPAKRCERAESGLNKYKGLKAARTMLDILLS